MTFDQLVFLYFQSQKMKTIVMNQFFFVLVRTAQHGPLTLAKYGSARLRPIQLTGSHMTHDFFFFFFFPSIFFLMK